MKTKTIPFDLETAQKIQAGEIKGEIKYAEGDSHAYDADIIKFDLIADKSKAKPNSTLFRTIVAVVDFDDYQGVRTFNTDGYGCNHSGDDTKLFIEVPDNEPQFKPFDKVLVRNGDHEAWNARLYDVWFAELGLHGTQDNKEWKQCIPYEGNQELVGTTDKPKEE